jgi:hypothetical protein
MSEYPQQPDPYEHAQRAEEVVASEKRIQTWMSEFEATLDPEQKTAFDKIFSPVGQVELIENGKDSGTSPFATHFGYFPRDMTTLQNSVYALMAADREEREARMIPEGTHHRTERILEAQRLREVAKRFRLQAK